MIELTKIESKYFDFTENNISSEEFERWVYQSKMLEKELNENDYLDLISLDFKTPSVKYELEKIFGNKIDKGKFETLRFLDLLESIIERDGKESGSLARMYDLYCDGYYFLQDLGLGIGLQVDYPGADYGVDTYNELNENQKVKLVNNAYPAAKELAEELKNWIVNGELILTGEVEPELNRWRYIDKRTVEDQKSRVWQTVSQSDQSEIISEKKNRLLEENSDFVGESNSSKKWWQRLFNK